MAQFYPRHNSSYKWKSFKRAIWTAIGYEGRDRLGIDWNIFASHHWNLSARTLYLCCCPEYIANLTITFASQHSHSSNCYCNLKVLEIIFISIICRRRNYKRLTRIWISFTAKLLVISYGTSTNNELWICTFWSLFLSRNNNCWKMFRFDLSCGFSALDRI